MTRDDRNALTTLQPGKLSVAEISKSFPPLVRRLLDSDMDARDAAAEVAGDPEARAVVVAHAGALAAAAAPSGDDGVFQAMQRLFIVYGRPKKLPEEMPHWWAEYYRALSNYPREALDHAVDRYILTAEIHMVPAPSVLAKLADPKALSIGRLAYRSSLVAKLAQPSEAKRPTDEERAEAKAFLADLKAGGLVKKPPAPERPRESREALSKRLRAADESQAAPIAPIPPPEAF